jgi:hypothetical protein
MSTFPKRTNKKGGRTHITLSERPRCNTASISGTARQRTAALGAEHAAAERETGKGGGAAATSARRAAVTRASIRTRSLGSRAGRAGRVQAGTPHRVPADCAAQPGAGFASRAAAKERPGRSLQASACTLAAPKGIGRRPRRLTLRCGRRAPRRCAKTP